MTYYLDFGPEGNSIRVPIPLGHQSAPLEFRKVPQYVIFENELPMTAKYRSKTIIQKIGNEYFKLKSPDGSIDQLGVKLSVVEEQELLLQIIKSEVWTRRSE